MARIKLTALVSSIIGKSGGSVFQGNNGMLSLRAKSANVNQKSSLQISQRAIAQRLQDEWRNLSIDEQASWRAFANVMRIRLRNDSQRIVGGQQLFFKINYYKLVVGFPIITTPVYTRRIVAPVAFYLYVADGQLYILPSATIVFGTQFVYIYISAPTRANINYKANTVKLLRIPIFGGAPVNITSAFMAAHGFMINNNDTVFFRQVHVEFTTGLPIIDVTNRMVIGDIPYRPQTLTLLARMADSYPSQQYINAMNDLIGGLVDAGIWVKLDLLYVFAMNQVDNACLNWLDNSYTITRFNSPVFVAGTGMQSANTAYLNTNFNMSTSPVNYAQNNASFGFMSYTAFGTLAYYLGTQQTGNFSMFRQDGASSVVSGVNSITQGSTGATLNGLHAHFNRAASGNYTLRIGAVTGTFNYNSVAMPNLNLYLLGLNNNGSLSSGGLRSLKHFYLGSSLTDGERTIIDNLFNSYYAAIL